MTPRKTSPGLKILWLWTLGTAAILVTNVVRTRLRDMDQLISTQQQQQQQQNSAVADSISADISPESDEGVIKEMKT
ncbi:hypothetical protein CFOL_v3_05335 [Cephalotus follicularis]|uniref:Uncharacterized protein n=1 Tax=Cephalotus follicularis TaxID=3775 RepID=A0A1Q3B1H0_CEPFO|nr:hypothetical protein CFOL_v3_05335 [Cephalotus follicularis]